MKSYDMCFCGLLLPEEKKLSEKCKGHMLIISVHKVAKALINGIDNNLDSPVKIFNIINTVNFPFFSKLFFKTEKWAHKVKSQDYHIGYINFFGIKYVTQSINLYWHIYNWIRNGNKKKYFIIVHHTYYPTMKAAIWIKKKFKKKVVICLITGDIPGKTDSSAQNKLTLKELMIRYLNKKVIKMVKSFDCFVFATKYMSKEFGVENKPLRVLECTYTPSEYNVDRNREDFGVEKNEKIVFYAGSLKEEYGIVHLLNSFKRIKRTNFRLWVAGGHASEKTINIMNSDSRIVYLGVITPKEVLERQNVATVLVSPRTSELEFTRYSFPSKTMECLASGKPYIAHKLPCEPDEYREYILYPDNESDEALSRKMEQVCELSDEERTRIGLRNKRFVENEKNPTIMCKRIVELADEMMKN